MLRELATTYPCVTLLAKQNYRYRNSPGSGQSWVGRGRVRWGDEAYQVGARPALVGRLSAAGPLTDPAADSGRRARRAWGGGGTPRRRTILNVQRTPDLSVGDLA